MKTLLPLIFCSLSLVTRASPFFERHQLWTEVQMLQSSGVRNLVGWQKISIPWITSVGVGAQSGQNSPEWLMQASLTHSITGFWFAAGTSSRHGNAGAGWSLVGIEYSLQSWQIVLRLPLSLFAIPR